MRCRYCRSRIHTHKTKVDARTVEEWLHDDGSLFCPIKGPYGARPEENLSVLDIQSRHKDGEFVSLNDGGTPPFVHYVYDYIIVEGKMRPVTYVYRGWDANKLSLEHIEHRY